MSALVFLPLITVGALMMHHPVSPPPQPIDLATDAPPVPKYTPEIDLSPAGAAFNAAAIEAAVGHAPLTKPPAPMAVSPVPKPEMPRAITKDMLDAIPISQVTVNWNLSKGLATGPALTVSTDAEGDTRDLQLKMKALGIFTGAVSGHFDTPTRQAMRTLSTLHGSPLDSTPEAERAIDALQAHADAMLYAVDQFPFAGTAPTWLLALLQDEDVSSIAEQLESGLNNDITQAMAITVKDADVQVVAMTRADPTPSTLHCRAYRLAFARASLHFAVTARACRNPSGDDWKVARR